MKLSRRLAWRMMLSGSKRLTFLQSQRYIEQVSASTWIGLLGEIGLLGQSVICNKSTSSLNAHKNAEPSQFDSAFLSSIDSIIYLLDQLRPAVRDCFRCGVECNKILGEFHGFVCIIRRELTLDRIGNLDG